MAVHHTTGQQGEEHAISFLQDKGYLILERNWRHKRGEIDIIASINNLIVFAEVKTRTTDKFGYPEQAVTSAKQNLLASTAEAYMHQKKLTNYIRFDIIAIVMQEEKYVIDHFEDAFFPNPTDELF